MNYYELKKRLEFVVYGENQWRISIRIPEIGSPLITYDVHGETVVEAKRTIVNIINIMRTPVHLNIIHGFNHGTAIKDMLKNESLSDKIFFRFCPSNNPGETILFIAA